jgi:hypothetical protein
MPCDPPLLLLLRVQEEIERELAGIRNIQVTESETKLYPSLIHKTDKNCESENVCMCIHENVITDGNEITTSDVGCVK